MNELIIFDPQANGHHPEFIQHLWNGLPGCQGGAQKISFVVHRQVAQILAPAINSSRVTIESLPASIEGDGNRLPDLTLARAQIGFLSRREPGRNRHWFFPYLNPYLRAFPASHNDQSNGEISSSGILFSPSSAAWSHSTCLWLEKWKAINEIRRIRRFRRKANLRKLFILNDTATAFRLGRLAGIPDGVTALADPVSPLRQCAAAASSSPLEATDRTTRFLLLGALRPGKGVLETLEAFSGWTPPQGQTITLTIAGAPTASFEGKVTEAIEEFRAKQSNVTLHLDLQFLSSEQMARHLGECDFLLLPYLRPLGSSGLLGHAARERKPVLASCDGLIGNLVREHNLGDTFDPRNPSEWHGVLDTAVKRKLVVDEDGADRYVKINSVEAFQTSLLDYLIR